MISCRVSIRRISLKRYVAFACLLLWPQAVAAQSRSEEHTSELQSQSKLVCRLLLEKKNKRNIRTLVMKPLTLKNHILPPLITTRYNVFHRDFTRVPAAIQNSVTINIGISQTTSRLN